MRQKLILISGTPSVGKTTTTEALFRMFDNSAFCDGDWVWHVNPFSLDDERLRDGDKNISYVLNTYLESGFDFVFCSSVLFMFKEVRKAILGGIAPRDYDVMGFLLRCDGASLAKRHFGQGEKTEPAYGWLDMEPCEGDRVIETSDKNIAEVCEVLFGLIGGPRRTRISALRE